MQTPDFFEELTGWRRFSVMANGTVLQSVGLSYPWTSADIGSAFCPSAVDHLAPFLQCACGYYAYKRREDATQHAQGSLLAKVKLWGRVVEHERGYRAERMRIDEIFVPQNYTQIDALIARYQISVTIDEGADAWISETQSGSFTSSLSMNTRGVTYLIQGATWTTVNTNPSQFVTVSQSRTPRKLAPSSYRVVKHGSAFHVDPHDKINGLDERMPRLDPAAVACFFAAVIALVGLLGMIAQASQ